MDTNKSFIIAELSANHNNDFNLAVKTIKAMSEAGADAVKIQTYNPESLTIDSDTGYFAPRTEGLWKGYTPWKLYSEAAMPYEWQPKLKKIAEELGLIFFSTPFDKGAVDFLESIDVPMYKIASFEITDIPLIKHAALKGKPMIILFELIGSEDPQGWYVTFMQLYLLLLAYLEVGKINLDLSRFAVNPAIIFIVIFAGIIFGGAGMLMLPEMINKPPGSDWNFVDALFTSASATCVTGLMVEETAHFFTFKGQLVLMFLIKIGGLNIVAFGIFMAVFSRFGIRLKQHDIIEDIVNKSTYQSAQGLFAKIFIISTLIELVGATCLFFLLPYSAEVAEISDKIFFSIFHSVSAFNNAGISLYEGGITNEAVAHCYPVLSIMGILIFLGALGFITILDVINVKELKERMLKPWKRLDIGSRVGLVSNFHLLIFGTVVFLLVEWSTGIFLGEENFVEKTVTAGFQVVNRTAGFASVDTGSLAIPVIILMLLLMFIGGSSSSTAGGIKTSTFTLLFVSVYTTIRGKKNAELYKKNIPSDLLIKAYAVMLFTLVNLFLWIFVLTITEAESIANGNMDILQLVFEEFSAFSTVGLSMGVTSQFSDAGLIVLTISMFTGRLGTLMLIMALSKQVKSNNYKYPDAHIMIG